MRGKEENEMGPVVSDTHQKKVLGYIDKGASEGRNWSSTGVSCACQAMMTGTMSAVRCSTT